MNCLLEFHLERMQNNLKTIRSNQSQRIYEKCSFDYALAISKMYLLEDSTIFSTYVFVLEIHVFMMIQEVFGIKGIV